MTGYVGEKDTPTERERDRTRARYGIGEWYGKLFVQLKAEERKRLAKVQALEKKERPTLLCPFRSSPKKEIQCTKEGGTCSIRLYLQDGEAGPVSVAPSPRGTLVTTCPYRFLQGGTIFRWVGETLLGHPKPLIVTEVGFLERAPADAESEEPIPRPEDVGRIDIVLVRPGRDPLHWCALEMQAVYFSGSSMSKEFKMLRAYSKNTLPFPAAHRRPDYRSSGPKRLMPQLQIKVPSLRRWGKKMGVVVDRNFFDDLGRMDDVRDVSNCDIAWFVVKYDEKSGSAVLTPDFVKFTTLERAVEGLTGGHPVSLAVFEGRIREKLAES